MPKKRYNAEEIIHKLREADTLLGHGNSHAANPSATCGSHGFSKDARTRDFPSPPFGGFGIIGSGEAYASYADDTTTVRV